MYFKKHAYEVIEESINTGNLDNKCTIDSAMFACHKSLQIFASAKKSQTFMATKIFVTSLDYTQIIKSAKIQATIVFFPHNLHKFLTVNIYGSTVLIKMYNYSVRLPLY